MFYKLCKCCKIVKIVNLTMFFLVYSSGQVAWFSMNKFHRNLAMRLFNILTLMAIRGTIHVYVQFCGPQKSHVVFSESRDFLFCPRITHDVHVYGSLQTAHRCGHTAPHRVIRATPLVTCFFKEWAFSCVRVFVFCHFCFLQLL